MLIKKGIFIVLLYNVSVLSAENWFSTHGQASCNSCCPLVEYLADDPKEEITCSDINVRLTRKQGAQVKLAKPKFKQYRKKLLNGKRPNVTVVTFDDDDQINNILERFGDLFKDKRPRKIPKPAISQSTKPKPTPKAAAAQNDMGDDYRAPLWPGHFVVKPKPTPKVGYSSWYLYSPKSGTQHTGTYYSSKYTISQAVSGKRKKREATKETVEVCPRRESWQDLNLALNVDGKLVQIVQLPSHDRKQWILEEVCTKKTSPALKNVSCQNRPRVITAVVVPLSGAKGSNDVQVQEIQLHCCAAYYTVP